MLQLDLQYTQANLTVLVKKTLKHDREESYCAVGCAQPLHSRFSHADICLLPARTESNC